MIKIQIFIALLFFGFRSHADTLGGGLFLEPAFTYQNGTLKVQYPVPFLSDSNENINGYGLGLRAGAHFADILFLAADIRYAQPNYESTALNGSAKAQALDYGLTIGLQTPFFGIRLWNTFILDGSLNPDTINSVDIEYKGLNGYRIGGGLYIAIVSLNLEYQEAKYKSTNVQSAGPFAPGALDNVNGTEKNIIFSVSFPLAL